MSGGSRSPRVSGREGQSACASPKGERSMSFGKAIPLAVRALRAEGKLPATLPAVQRDKLIVEKLKELGLDTRHGPSRWTLARHLARLEAGDATCTFCTMTN